MRNNCRITSILDTCCAHLLVSFKFQTPTLRLDALCPPADGVSPANLQAAELRPVSHDSARFCQCVGRVIKAHRAVKTSRSLTTTVTYTVTSCKNEFNSCFHNWQPLSPACPSHSVVLLELSCNPSKLCLTSFPQMRRPFQTSVCFHTGMSAHGTYLYKCDYVCTYIRTKQREREGG